MRGLPDLADLPELIEVRRFAAVMSRLRVECPWDAEQTHRSLVPYLIEEVGEAVDAIESGDRNDMREELGDVLLQVIFHATIAAETDAFDLDDVAAGIADKLIDRHPYVFGDADTPADLMGSWEERKRVEKSRDSALDGIAEHLSAMARAGKVISRARSHRVDLPTPSDPITADDFGRQVLALVSRAHHSGFDPEQALRDALGDLERGIRETEGAQTQGAETA